MAWPVPHPISSSRGEGYTTDAGTSGRRGYQGEYRFTFLGATTPPPDRLWKILGKLGNRLCFLNMPEIQAESIAGDFAMILREEDPYKSKLEVVRRVTCNLLDQLHDLAPVNWDKSQDPQKVVETIAKFAELSGRLRGIIPKVRLEDGRYRRGFPQIEKPMRFATLLYNLSRGRALVNGRRNINMSDLDLVYWVALSSCQEGRWRLLSWLIQYGGEATTQEVEELLGCSKEYALDLMRDLDALGVVFVYPRTLPKGGREMRIEISD